MQRVTLLALIIIVSTPNGIAKIVIYGIVILISMVQISALEQQHRYSFWLSIYPLQPEWRVTALAKIIFSVISMQSLLLAFVLLFVHVSFLLVLFICSLSCLFCALYSFVVYPRKLRRILLQT
jgi:ABC-2 type transport system permease protein